MQNLFRRLNPLGLLAVIIVNALAELLPINGTTTKALSDRYPVLITPAGYAFAIWTLIYALLVGFAIYQSLPAGRNRPAVRRIGPWFLVSCVLNIAWILFWHYEIVVGSGFVMLALLISLIIIYDRVRTASNKPTTGERWFVLLPFSLYLGWICVATIVNIAVVLYDAGWNGFGLADTTWTVIMLAVAVLLAAAIARTFKDASYALVFVWAFVAIAVKQADRTEIVVASLVGAVVLALFAAIIGLRTFRRRQVSSY